MGAICVTCVPCGGAGASVLVSPYPPPPTHPSTQAQPQPPRVQAASPQMFPPTRKLAATRNSIVLYHPVHPVVFPRIPDPPVIVAASAIPQPPRADRRRAKSAPRADVLELVRRTPTLIG